MTVLRLFDGATPWTADPGRLQAVKQHGGIAVSVYVVGSPGGMRCANKADVAAARALDLGVLPNWERAVDALCSGGKANGQTVGAEALAACRALGFPDDGTVAVPFSWDVQIPAGKLDDCGQVADGIIAGLAGHYLFTAYGPQNLVDYLHNTGRLQSAAWLTASTFGQPYNPAAPYVAVVQSHDAAGNWLNSPVAGTDVNTITQPDRLAAWWPDGSPYGGDTLSASDVQQILAAINAVPGKVWSQPVAGVDGNGKPVTWQAQTWLHYAGTQAEQAQIDPDKLAAGIAAQLPGVTEAQVAAAVKAAIQGAQIVVPS